MLRNKIDPITLIGTPLLLIGAFLLSISYQIYDSMSHYYNQDDLYAIIIFGIMGISFSALSIAFLVKREWARMALVILCLIGALVWTFFLYVLVISGNNTSANAVTIGMSIMVYGILLLYALILQNEFVIQHFRNKLPTLREEREDILDL